MVWEMEGEESGIVYCILSFGFGFGSGFIFGFLVDTQR